MTTSQSNYGRRFYEEFKREVAALAHRPGARLEQVASDLGVSMSRAGNCYDNAWMESFWAALKTELIDGHVYASPDKSALSSTKLSPRTSPRRSGRRSLLRSN